MLASLMTQKGAPMNRQRLLFEHPLVTQMDKVWQQLGAADKRRIIAILTQMGKATVPSSLTAEKEADDES